MQIVQPPPLPDKPVSVDPDLQPALATGVSPIRRQSAKSNARSRACRADVKRMVAEIRKPAADRLEITQDELIKRADEIFKLAMASGQLGAAVNALKELGILSGRRIERAERGESGELIA